MLEKYISGCINVMAWEEMVQVRSELLLLSLEATSGKQTTEPAMQPGGVLLEAQPTTSQRRPGYRLNREGKMFGASRST